MRRALLAMPPHHYRTSAEARETLLKRKALTVSEDVRVVVYASLASAAG
ncbi:hypothetical protein [Parahaliea aestuarii]|nr:hypothetical protein [Parahaliea aestuarii]